MNTLLDAILRETGEARRNAVRQAWEASLERNVEAYRYLAHRTRMRRLAERSGTKGAIAGHLDDLLHHS